MTETTTTGTPPTAEEVIAGIAERDAEWVERTWRDTPMAGDVLQFLRFRPRRELGDVIAAARRLGLGRAEEIVGDAARLADGHTGSASVCPEGYEPIVYPVSDEEVEKILAGAAEAANRLQLPGTFTGWSWDREVSVDQDTATVRVELTPRHPGFVRG